MQRNIKNPGKSPEKPVDFPNLLTGDNRAKGSTTGSRQYNKADELEILKEAINNLRCRLHLLIIESECSLVSEEVLNASRALDELVSAYQKALRNFEEPTEEQ